MAEPPVELGWVAPELAEELPDLALRFLTLDARPDRSPEPVRRRLGQLAGRITGGHVIHMRQDPVPWAYRVFWRQVGIDPDTVRTPVERIAVERLKQGGLPSRNLLELLGASGRALPARQIVIADQERPLAVLGGEVAADRGVVRATTRMAIAAVQVKGVPEMSVEEALWTVAGVLSSEW